MIFTDNDLAAAVHQRSGFCLHYQPIINLNSREVSGFEALIRWHHPQFGLIPPDRFIPMAEQSGLIRPLGEWIIQEVCRQLLRQPGYAIATNVSPVQFSDTNFVDTLLEYLHRQQCDIRNIEVEITESVLLSDIENIRNKIKTLRSAGIAVVLDDFGAGYTSVHYLYQYEFDKVKIDKSLIMHLGENRKNRIVVGYLIDTLHEMGIKVTAEGVETAAQMHILGELECDSIQGFFVSRPLTIDQLDRFISG
ncbi:putative bifunctional diguanylate cyclase/phosphodiesterase [Musicola keenii]|uniref:putative bifunctional diguanylate cyclase/phosphodiesterase n=1 Tax=Musicola keenii TaxID=2884250 RepID=UPI0017840BDA|nr:EAL domain-containing protein [Musicola keenii]